MTVRLSQKIALFSMSMLVSQLASAGMQFGDQLDPYVGVGTGLNRSTLSRFENTTPGGSGALATGRDHDVTPSLDARAGVGYSINNLHMRTELSLGWQGATHYYRSAVFPGVATTTSLDARVTPYTLMANQYIDMPIYYTGWQPYVMGGLGVAWNRVNLISDLISSGTLLNSEHNKGTQTRFAWQAGLGMHHPLSARWDLQAGYRHASYGKIKFDLADFGSSAQRVRAKRFHQNSLHLAVSYHPKQTVDTANVAQAETPPQPVPLDVMQDATRPAVYTIQLALLSDRGRVQDVIDQNDLVDAVDVYPLTYTGAERYLLVYGSYPDQASAEQALAELPKAVQALQPFVQQITRVHAYVETHGGAAV